MPQLAPAAISALVDNHRRFLAFLESRVGGRDQAEEILQAAFVRGIERAGEIRDDERAVAWFYRLLRNAVVDHRRARAAETRGQEALAREHADHAVPAPEIEAEICRCFEALLPTCGRVRSGFCAGSTLKARGRSTRPRRGDSAERGHGAPAPGAPRATRAAGRVLPYLRRACCLDCSCARC